MKGRIASTVPIIIREVPNQPRPCIYRIPKCLRGGGRDRNAYIPQVVSIGPYHHNPEQLRDMEVHKQRLLNEMLTRTKKDENFYLEAINELAERAKGCYDEEINLEQSRFKKMMMLDGCFIIEFLRGFTENGYSPRDPIFERRHMIYSISRDMILLENQIPFFILKELWKLQSEENNEKGLRKLCIKFFNSFFLTEEGPQNKPSQVPKFPLSTDDFKGVLHWLDIFRRSFHSSPYETSSATQGSLISRALKRHVLIPSVTDLKEVGVKFKKQEDNNWRVDFNDKSGELRLPRLFIDDKSKYLFLNLIAFEQCHINEGDHITSLLTFMDTLINTSKDVGHLKKCEIIDNWLGDDNEVAGFFNTMGQGVVINIYQTSLNDKCERINDYYENKWNAWCAMLNRDYFSTPWLIISVVAATVLLLLTLGQTFYTIFPYYHPRN